MGRVIVAVRVESADAARIAALHTGERGGRSAVLREALARGLDAVERVRRKNLKRGRPGHFQRARGAVAGRTDPR